MIIKPTINKKTKVEVAKWWSPKKSKFFYFDVVFLIFIYRRSEKKIILKRYFLFTNLIQVDFKS